MPEFRMEKFAIWNSRCRHCLIVPQQIRNRLETDKRSRSPSIGKLQTTPPRTRQPRRFLFQEFSKMKNQRPLQSPLNLFVVQNKTLWRHSLKFQWSFCDLAATLGIHQNTKMFSTPLPPSQTMQKGPPNEPALRKKCAQTTRKTVLPKCLARGLLEKSRWGRRGKCVRCEKCQRLPAQLGK